MKKLFPSLVAVKRITCTVPRSNFAEADLDKLARLILESGGLINPIIVRRNGMDAYKIVDGDFEYYAAARAKEIEPLKGETIGAFILEEENEELLLEQLKIIRKTAITDNLVKNPETGFLSENTASQPADSIKNPVSLVEVPKSYDNETPQSSSSLEQRLTNIEAQFASQINELKAEYTHDKQVLAESLQEIKNRINELKLPSPPEKLVVVERVEEVEKVTSESMSLLEALNTLDEIQLSAIFKDVGLKLPAIKKIVENIVEQRGVRKFVSFANVVERVNGLTAERMIKIIDKWEKYS